MECLVISDILKSTCPLKLYSLGNEGKKEIDSN